jgi:hypothetical protein
MTRKELKELIWSIYQKVIEDEQLGYNYFIETHDSIPDEWYEVYYNELNRMCLVYLNSNENSTTSTKTITFHQILIFLRNDYQQINPALKLEFREKPIVKCNSFVKYFKMLQEEGIILNTNEELSKILNFITRFEFGSIQSNMNDKFKLKRVTPLLPEKYLKH